MSVRVELGARSYEVRIDGGLIGRAGTEIAPLSPGPEVSIVTEERVAAAHLEALRAGLAAEGIASDALVLPPGEGTKSWEHLTRTCDWLLGRRVERSGVVVALGGGVVGDLAGFASAVLRRGVRFV